jgi:hypothetical protein
MSQSAVAVSPPTANFRGTIQELAAADAPVYVSVKEAQQLRVKIIGCCSFHETRLLSLFR